uniref:ENTH domain-containing protein n=1 Tax=Macrostomum lignano TaxID=282301 RepID=A0A1I8F5T9_9PLAT
VREATSNDPWGPSSTLMAEIAEMTYNVMAYTEIMSLILERLNDKNKNWRHVYKALVLLTTSRRWPQQCKENLFVIQSLRDFQFTEEAKDYGQNVREKAKQLRSAHRERLHASGMIGGGRPTVSVWRDCLRRAQRRVRIRPDRQRWPRSSWRRRRRRWRRRGEDVELELALAISKEEHAEELKRREAEGLKDDLKLKMASRLARKNRAAWSTSSTHRCQPPRPTVRTPWGARRPPLGSLGPGPIPGLRLTRPRAALHPCRTRPPRIRGLFSATPSQPQAGGGTFDYAFGSPATPGRPLFSRLPRAAGFPADGSTRRATPSNRLARKSRTASLGDHGNWLNLDSLVAQPKGTRAADSLRAAAPGCLRRRHGFGLSAVTGSAGARAFRSLIEAPQQRRRSKPPAYRRRPSIPGASQQSRQQPPRLPQPQPPSCSP